MNYEEVIQAWEKVLAMGDAPIGEHWGCWITTKLAKETFDMLNRQKAEIERLQKAIKVQDIMIEQQDYKIKTAKSKARKEFAERFQEKAEKTTWISSGEFVVKDYKISREEFEHLLAEMESEEE